MRQRLRQQLYLDHSPSLLLRRMGKWMRFRLLTEPASQETTGRLTAALSVRSLCIFFFLRPVLFSVHFSHESAGPLIYCHMQEVPI